MNTHRDGDATTASPVGEDELGGLFDDFRRYPRIALAVSGGADSMALMRLAHTWSALTDTVPRVTVLTVDHGLRAAAAAEAEWVKTQAGALGLEHETLVWTGAKPASGVQAKARAARYALMCGYCRDHHIPALATAHTADDQAETLLMRLARGSGVDGLSAMSERSALMGVDIVRPLLGVPRSRLVAWLLARGHAWLDDPSNEDERYERVRIRRGLERAGGLGLSTEALELSARRLRRARDALNEMTARFLRDALIVHESGYGELSLVLLFGAPEEIALKALSHMAVTFGGRGDAPRLSKLEAAYASLRQGARGVTLGGCRFSRRQSMLLAVREFGRMETQAKMVYADEPVLWDGRFTLTVTGGDAYQASALNLRPLGADGLAAIAGWHGSMGTIPRIAAIVLPSLWDDDRLLYAPFVDWREGVPPGWLGHCRVRFSRSLKMSVEAPKLSSPRKRKSS